jgi:hypothetical protein
MQVDWAEIRTDTPRLRDLKPGDAFVIPGNDGLYVRTNGDQSHEGKQHIGTVELETGSHFYKNQDSHVCKVSVAVVSIPEEG